MLAGFFDGSGTHDNHGRYVMAGFVAFCSTWAEIAEKWATVLLEEPCIPHFRMADTRQPKWREKYHISEDQMEQKIERLSSIVAPGHVLFSVICSISLDDFNEVVTEHLAGDKEIRKHLGKLFSKNPYSILFHRTVGQTVMHVHEMGISGDQVDFVFDRENQLFDQAKLLLDRVRSDVPKHLQGYIGDAIPRNSRTTKPLQAADLIAARSKDQCNDSQNPKFRDAITLLAGSVGNQNVTQHISKFRLEQLVDALLAKEPEIGAS